MPKKKQRQPEATPTYHEQFMAQLNAAISTYKDRHGRVEYSVQEFISILRKLEK